MRIPKRWLRKKPMPENVTQCILSYGYTEISVDPAAYINDIIITNTAFLLTCSIEQSPP